MYTEKTIIREDSFEGDHFELQLKGELQTADRKGKKNTEADL